MQYVHHGKGTVRAYVFGPLGLLDFVEKVFAPVEVERNALPNGGYHVQKQLGDSIFVLSVANPPYEQATKASIYVYVPDVDATYQRALEAGATSVSEPADKPWKGRNAGVKDSFGNVWYIETYKG